MATSDAVLALLLPGPSHGYDLKKAHDEWFAGLKPLAFGQVYATLARLERDGLVRVAHTENGEGPERVVYELTPEGREKATGWLAEPSGATAPGDDLARRVLAAFRLGARPLDVVATQRAAHLRRMRAAEGEGGLGLLAEHTRLHLDADLRWLDHVAARPPTSSAAIAPAATQGEEES